MVAVLDNMPILDSEGSFPAAYFNHRIYAVSKGIPKKTRVKRACTPTPPAILADNSRPVPSPFGDNGRQRRHVLPLLERNTSICVLWGITEEMSICYLISIPFLICLTAKTGMRDRNIFDNPFTFTIEDKPVSVFHRNTATCTPQTYNFCTL
jgi:hypothetical protein